MSTERLTENQTELLSLLRASKFEGVKVSTIQWPSYIEVKSLGLCEDNRKIYFHLRRQAVVSNMQTDSSSFEGWAIVVVAWLKEGKDIKVEMSWDDPEEFDLSCQVQRNQYRHYQRYLYRVIRFREIFEWFDVAPQSENLLTESQVLLPDGRGKEGRFFLNSGRQDVRGSVKPACDKVFKELSEDCIERMFLNEPNSLMQCAFGRRGQTLMRQFPVGVFKGAVKSTWEKSDQGMPIFTGGKSAIDLWAMGDGRAAIFELKRPSGNKKVGVVSELIFYANIVRDAQSGFLEYESPDAFEKQLQGTEGVDSYFLLGEKNIHPLLNSKKVIDCLNESASKREIVFDIIYYNSELECKKVHWSNYGVNESQPKNG